MQNIFHICWFLILYFQVTGFDNTVSEDALRLYFANKKRSGGGDISIFNLDREKGFAHISFKEKEGMYLLHFFHKKSTNKLKRILVMKR